jgi:DNA-binding NarL/FixJ family response regulator
VDDSSPYFQPAIRVVVVDDHEMLLDGLRTGLDRRPNIKVVGAVQSVADVLAGIEQWAPDVVVADFHLPDGTGLDVARKVDATPTILITGLARAGLLHEAIAVGCRGLLSKSVTIAELADAIDVVARGGSAFSADELQALASVDRTEAGATLTSREREVLALLADARNAEYIAEHLQLSINTVRKHIASILTKLHSSSQLEAVITAQRAGIV